MKNLIHRILPLVLATVLPVMPLLRSLMPAASQGLAPSAWSIILKLGVGATALLGGYDAVSGASVSILPPVNGGFTIRLTNGIFYKLKLAETPYVAGSWTTNAVQNTTTPVFNLFPGFYLTNATGYLAGTPVITGGRQTNRFTIYVWGEGSEAAQHVSANFTNIIFPAIPGTLVVTASPPALVTLAKNLTWNLDGQWQTNGTTNLFLDAGLHTVTFTNLPGWLAPPSQSVTITNAVQTRISVVYTQLLGGLQVNLQPLGPPAGTATWSIDGSPAYASGTITNLPVLGTHTLAFNPVTGYVTPAAQTITVTNGVTNVINAVYLSPAAGTIQVNLGPSAAVSAGALWQLDNGPWLASGTATNGSPGGHTLKFATVTSWAAPASLPVNLTAGALTTATATYLPITAPVITQTSVAGTNLLLQGTGTANAGFSVRSINNLATPMAGWPVTGTGTINAAGLFNYSVPLDPATPAAYFRLSTP